MDYKPLVRIEFTFPDGTCGHEVEDFEKLGEMIDYINANYPTVVDFRLHVLSEEEAKNPIR